MKETSGKKAVFLDRDGVLNALVLSPDSGKYEPPHSMKELKLLPRVVPSLKKLQEAGYYLFLVSNQPDYALGKTTLNNLKLVHKKFSKLMKKEGIRFKKYYYCYHHPSGTVPLYSIVCKCRKPEPFFLIEASKDYGMDLSSSWMIGDTDRDVEAGKGAGVKTILVDYELSRGQRNASGPDYKAKNLNIAVDIILGDGTE